MKRFKIKINYSAFLAVFALIGMVFMQIGFAALNSELYITGEANFIPGEPEEFLFTIDTRMTDTVDTDPTHFSGTATTFSIPTSGTVGIGSVTGSTLPYDWIIDWGDGSATETATAANGNQNGIPHIYPAAGEYQITIKTNNATDGWLDAFGFIGTTSSNTTNANYQPNRNMIKSIDTLRLTTKMRTMGATYRFAYMFWGCKNLVGIPPNLFNGTFSMNSIAKITTMKGMFQATFQNAAYNSTTAAIPQNLFSQLSIPNTVTDVSFMFSSFLSNYGYRNTNSFIPNSFFGAIRSMPDSITDMSYMFESTFEGNGYNNQTYTAPTTLFRGLTMPNRVTNISGLFRGLFNNVARNATGAVTFPDAFSNITIPASVENANDLFFRTFYHFGYSCPSLTIPSGLFSSFYTNTVKDFSGMYCQTFDSCAYNSTTATIPSNLFGTINMPDDSIAINTFYSTFSSYGHNSTSGTIPADLFSKIHTKNAKNLQGFLSYCFYHCLRNSTTGTIPSGLIDTITTSNATILSGIYSYMFTEYAYNSSIITIPDKFFGSLDLSNMDITHPFMCYLFSSTFSGFGESRPSTEPKTDINNIWGNANFAGKVTADVARYMFQATFMFGPKITGAALTFINNKLDGVTPSASTRAFTLTSVTDLASLPAYWK